MTNPALSPITTGTLHFFCGKVGAGKTTLAATLAEQPKHVLMVEDEWLTKLFRDEIQEFDDYVRCTWLLREYMAPHLTQLLRIGISVVLDFQSNTIKTRQWARQVFEAAEAPHQLHWLDIPDDECRRRMHQRNAAGTHPYQLTDDDFDHVTSFFVAPAPEEGFNIVRHGI